MDVKLTQSHSDRQDGIIGIQVDMRIGCSEIHAVYIDFKVALHTISTLN